MLGASVDALRRGRRAPSQPARVPTAQPAGGPRSSTPIRFAQRSCFENRYPPTSSTAPPTTTLGVIHLTQGRLYQAATEFEWARKLMPGHPDPRLNLALALERGGRITEALEAFDAALEVYPNHLPTVMALARCQVRHHRADDRTDDLLHDIALRGDQEWRSWARSQQIRRAFPPPRLTHFPRRARWCTLLVRGPGVNSDILIELARIGHSVWHEAMLRAGWTLGPYDERRDDPRRARLVRSAAEDRSPHRRLAHRSRADRRAPGRTGRPPTEATPAPSAPRK